MQHFPLCTYLSNLDAYDCAVLSTLKSPLYLTLYSTLTIFRAVSTFHLSLYPTHNSPPSNYLTARHLDSLPDTYLFTQRSYHTHQLSNHISRAQRFPPSTHLSARRPLYVVQKVLSTLHSLLYPIPSPPFSTQLLYSHLSFQFPLTCLPDAWRSTFHSHLLLYSLYSTLTILRPALSTPVASLLDAHAHDTSCSKYFLLSTHLSTRHLPSAISTQLLHSPLSTHLFTRRCAQHFPVSPTFLLDTHDTSCSKYLLSTLHSSLASLPGTPNLPHHFPLTSLLDASCSTFHPHLLLYSTLTILLATFHSPLTSLLSTHLFTRVGVLSHLLKSACRCVESVKSPYRLAVSSRRIKSVDAHDTSKVRATLPTRPGTHLSTQHPPLYTTLGAALSTLNLPLYSMLTIFCATFHFPLSINFSTRCFAQHFPLFNYVFT